MVNDPALTAWARERLSARLGADKVVASAPVMGAEDFAWFAQRAPGVYFRLGATAPGTTNGGLHTPTFKADDASIPVGMRAMGELVMDFLTAPPALAAPQASKP
jgi:amidohydrolase